jgi:hypothetical protein
MLMNDLQVNEWQNRPSDNLTNFSSYVNVMPMFSMEQMKVNLFYAIHFLHLQI